MSGEASRRAGLAAALDRVRTRVAAAEAAATRPPGSVSLVVVTKTYPVSDVALLVGLGVRAVGESREPEAGDKALALAGASSGTSTGGAPLEWHQVGQVQTRAARAVARWADVVHSVDRPRLVAALERGAEQAGRRLRVLVQVGLDAPEVTDALREAGRAPRGGVAPAGVAALAGSIAGCAHLELVGLTGVAPREGGPERAYDALQAASAALVRDHPGAWWISAGTSADLEVAVARGATLVRVGTAILGERPAMP